MDTARHAEIIEGLAVLLEPGQVTELRAFLPSRKPHQASGVCWRNPEAMARRALEIEPEVTGIYLTVNPLDPALIPPKRDRVTATADSSVVVARRWLLLDVDPVRRDDDGSMLSEVPSTDAEREAAWHTLHRCREVCESFGMVGRVMGDSGNGWHLLYPIDLPTDEATTQDIKDFLAGMKRRCGDDATIIDPKVCDLPRIWKLYGTLSRKGQETADRPYRYSRLIEGQPPTDEQRQTNNAALRSMLATWSVQDAAMRPSMATPSSVVDRARAYLTHEDPSISGQRGHDRCYHVACILVWGFGLDHNEALAAISDWNARCVPPWSERELGHKFEQAMKGTHREARGYLRDRERAREGLPSSLAIAQGRATEDGELVVRASKVEPRKIEWLWPGRIPLGKLTTFAGQGGVGKTFTLCDITARITQGCRVVREDGRIIKDFSWPDDPNKEEMEPANVLFISGEDDADDTLVPRLIELGADPDRVCFLADAAQSLFTLDKVDLLDRAVQETGGNVRLVVIDPPASYLGGTDDHSNAELRQILTPLKVFASRHRLAVVFNTHLNKGGAGKVDAMARVMASVAWVNAVRAAHLFAIDPDDPQGERVLFVPLKLNLGKKRRGLAYRIVEASNDLARVEWLGEIDTTADQAIQPRTSSRQLREVKAREWIIQTFRSQREWKSDDLKKARSEAGISKNAFDEGLAQLNPRPEPRRRVYSDGTVVWIWSVPDGWQPDGEPPPSEDTRAF